MIRALPVAFCPPYRLTSVVNGLLPVISLYKHGGRCLDIVRNDSPNRKNISNHCPSTCVRRCIAVENIFRKNNLNVHHISYRTIILADKHRNRTVLPFRIHRVAGRMYRYIAQNDTLFPSHKDRKHIRLVSTVSEVCG